MTGYLRGKGYRISEGVVRKSLNNINVVASQNRTNFAMRSLNPKVYHADYFGQKMHIDQNEKISMYGVTHICARDGYSGFIVAFVTMPIKNNLQIYEHILRSANLYCMEYIIFFTNMTISVYFNSFVDVLFV